MIYLEYPKCSTCKKAKKFLQENNKEFSARDIVLETPSVEELNTWIDKSGLPLKRFFNTSGMKYKELKLSQTFDSYSREELVEMLSKDGMLIKRPLLVGEDFVKTGFRVKEWEEL